MDLRSITLLVLSGATAFSARALEVEVEIDGLVDELERNARAFLSIAELEGEVEAAVEDEQRSDGVPAEPPEAVTERRVLQLHAAAGDEIRAALEPFGYYAAEVRSSIERSGDTWRARYEVEPGRRVLLSEVDIRAIGDGAETQPIRAAISSITLRPGDALLHPTYEAAKQTLFDAAYRAGYIDAAFERAELRVDRGARAAEIHLVLDTGPRYYFGEITVEQEILYDSFVNRFVTIAPGDPFDTDRLLALQIALNDSGYFGEVVVDVQRENEVDRRVPVVVYTTPRRPQEYTLGLGYGTDTGPRLSVGVDLRRINPRGHRFSADLRVSHIEQAVALEYRIPARNLATDFLSLRGALGNEEIGGWDTRQRTGGATWHDAWRHFQRRIYVTALREEFWTPLQPTAREDALFSGIQLTATQADNQLYPMNGHSWSVDVRAGSEALWSSTTFSRMHATANLVRSLGDRVRFLLRAEYGAIDADDFDRLPPSQRFYAGGDSSVRGYPYQGLGPTDENGAIAGGRYVFSSSAEIELMIVGNYGAAAFFDVGNAANDPRPSSMRGVGVGVRWRSPVGVIGIDIAHPLDDPDTDYRLHLRVGGNL